MKRIHLLFSAVLLLPAFNVFAAEAVAPPENVAAPPADAMQFSEGMHFIVLKPGTGQLATKKYIKSLATGWTSANGKTQFSAIEDGESADNPDSVSELFPGISTALRATPIGEQRRWWIAADLMLPGWTGFEAGDYTIDLEVTGEIDPLPAPADVAQSPPSAITTASGLRYRVLKPGTGTATPALTDIVRVHYTGWTTDGEMFDSSLIRGKPADFLVTGVIQGMSEALQTMVVGETTRIWIPAELAYGANPRPGAPAGELVFDVELLEIIPAG